VCVDLGCLTDEVPLAHPRIVMLDRRSVRRGDPGALGGRGRPEPRRSLTSIRRSANRHTGHSDLRLSTIG
jgi:hypothetical protein